MRRDLGLIRLLFQNQNLQKTLQRVGTSYEASNRAKPVSNIVEKLDVIAKPSSCAASGSKISFDGVSDVRVANAPSLLQVMFKRGASGARASSAPKVPMLSVLFPERPKFTTNGRTSDRTCAGFATMSVLGTDRVPLIDAAIISPI